MPTLQSKQKANMIGITDPSKRIYRILTLDRLFDTIVGKRLALVRPRLWDDPFENLLYQTPWKTPAGESISIEPLRNSLYGQCWTLASESDALWRIYSPYKIGVRVSTTVGKLFSAVWNDDDRLVTNKYFIGKMEYWSKSRLLKMLGAPSKSIFDSTGRAQVVFLLRKPKAFQHEKEIRLVFHAIEDRQDDVIFCPIDPNALFETLLFDPRMDPLTIRTFTTVLRQIGFKNPISQSTLYNAPQLKGHVTYPRAK